MDNSYNQFKLRFIEEATDHINDLERALLELERDPANGELVELVFRAMHSLKGGGGMFGFDKLSEFTHDLENIYDLIRSGALEVSSPLLSITLKSVDLLRDLLDDASFNSVRTTQRYHELKRQVNEVVKVETQGLIAGLVNSKASIEKLNQVKQQTATYHIHFRPGAGVLQNGTNLLYLIDEICEMGSVVAVPLVGEVPVLCDFDPVKCYLGWDLVVATEKTVQDLRDVFLFVEDDSKIEIEKLADEDLLSKEEIRAMIEGLAVSGGNMAPGAFKEMIRQALCSEVVAADEFQDGQPCQASKMSQQSSLRVSSEKIDGLMNLVSELVISQERLGLIAGQHHIPELKQVAHTIQKLTAQLRDSTFGISLIPIESLTMRFQRLVRDLGAELGKEIDFITEGEETQLDKSMIERLTDPLLHIIRNSIDHGIELPQERELAGKPVKGRIRLKAFYSGANVIMEISDDGAGIDPAVIRTKAIAKGFIDRDAVLSEQEILNLLFYPGFSTRDCVSAVSGRGVGMDVVKKNIEAIRGEVVLSSVPGRGTTVKINLPLVLSIIDGLLVTVSENQYVIPLSSVDHIYPLESSELGRVFNNQIVLNGIQYPFFNLRNVFSSTGELPRRMEAVLVNDNGQKVAFSVDRVNGKIQAVLKPLGKFYHNHKFLSAATIMGDGAIALVLDPSAIIKKYV